MKKIISIVALAACAMMLMSCNNVKKNAAEAVEEAAEVLENAADSLSVEEIAEAIDSTVVAE